MTRPGPGWQSGVKTGIGAVTVPLFGAEICGSIGLEAGSTILHPDKVIRDCEALRHAAAMVGPAAFRDEDLALDVIRAVGPRGHFMGQRHTREHLRDHHLPLWLTHAGREAVATMRRRRRRGGRPRAGPRRRDRRVPPPGARASSRAA